MARAIWKITKIALLILLAIGVFRTLINAERISLTGFISTLERAPVIDINELEFLTEWVKVDMNKLIPTLANLDWGVFDFLRMFYQGFRNAIVTSLEIIQMIGQFVILIFNGVAQLMIYIGYFMKYIFIIG